MKTHVEELIEKWRNESVAALQSGCDNMYVNVFLSCARELKEALLLDEADKVGK